MKYFKIGFQLGLGWLCANLLLGVINLYVACWARYLAGG